MFVFAALLWPPHQLCSAPDQLSPTLGSLRPFRATSDQSKSPPLLRPGQLRRSSQLFFICATCCHGYMGKSEKFRVSMSRRFSTPLQDVHLCNLDSQKLKFVSHQAEQLVYFSFHYFVDLRIEMRAECSPHVLLCTDSDDTSAIKIDAQKMLFCCSCCYYRRGLSIMHCDDF